METTQQLCSTGRASNNNDQLFFPVGYKAIIRACSTASSTDGSYLSINGCTTPAYNLSAPSKFGFKSQMISNSLANTQKCPGRRMDMAGEVTSLRAKTGQYVRYLVRTCRSVWSRARKEEYAGRR